MASRTHLSAQHSLYYVRDASRSTLKPLTAVNKLHSLRNNIHLIKSAIRLYYFFLVSVRSQSRWYLESRYKCSVEAYHFLAVQNVRSFVLFLAASEKSELVESSEPIKVFSGNLS